MEHCAYCGNDVIDEEQVLCDICLHHLQLEEAKDTLLNSTNMDEIFALIE